MNIYWIFGDGAFVFARLCLWSSVTQRCWSVPVRSITALCWPPPRSPGEPSQQIWHLIFSAAVAVPSYLSARCPRLSRSHLLNPPPQPPIPSPISPNLPLPLKRGEIKEEEEENRSNLSHLFLRFDCSVSIGVELAGYIRAWGEKKRTGIPPPY